MRQHLLLIAGTAAAMLGSCSQSPGDALIAKAEDAVRHGARDPGALKFRDVAVCPKDAAAVTGKFNGKNAYGAYAGFAAFIYSSDGTISTTDDANFLTILDRCYGSSTRADDPSS